MNNTNETFEQWAVIELFGHNQIAGLVSEQSIGGASFIRVDVPETNGASEFTKFYGASAIYAITPCGENEARIAAEKLEIRPISNWIVPHSPALPAPQEIRDQLIRLKNAGLLVDELLPYTGDWIGPDDNEDDEIDF